MSTLKDKALRALSKPSPYGPDININEFDLSVRSTHVSIDSLISEAREPAMRIGLKGRGLNEASYVQVNEALLYRTIISKLRDHGVIIMSTGDALRTYTWVRDYYWRLIDVDTDKYTAATELFSEGRGYFIYVPKGVKIPYPIYTCLLMTRDKTTQIVHNIVIVDDDAELNLVTGCASSHRIGGALHIGVSEFYVGRNAKLSFAMIHAWGRGVHVRPRTSVLVKEGGTYISYYVIYSDVKSLQQYPRVLLEDNAKAYITSIIVGSNKSIYDSGAEAVLKGRNSRAEIVSRAVAKDESLINARARIKGMGVGSKGHIECLGLLLSSKAHIHAIPELESLNEDSLLSHEAAIGRIAEEEIEYLMSKGFTEEEAKSIILRGFMKVDVPGLPKPIKAVVNSVIKMLSEKSVT